MNARLRPVGVVAGAAALAATVVLGVGSPASAAANVPVAGLSLTPSAASVGQPVSVAATATNAGSTRLGQVALGVLTPLGGTSIVPPKNAQCRQTVVTGKRLVYCLVSGLPVGQTATLKFTVTPGAAGSYVFSSYARNVSTNDETGATATLTVA